MILFQNDNIKPILVIKTDHPKNQQISFSFFNKKIILGDKEKVRSFEFDSKIWTEAKVHFNHWNEGQQLSENQDEITQKNAQTILECWITQNERV